MNLLDQVEKETIRKVLSDNGGNVAKTARELGIDRRTLYRKMNAYGWVVETEVTKLVRSYQETPPDIQDVE